MPRAQVCSCSPGLQAPCHASLLPLPAATNPHRACRLQILCAHGHSEAAIVPSGPQAFAECTLCCTMLLARGSLAGIGRKEAAAEQPPRGPGVTGREVRENSLYQPPTK